MENMNASIESISQVPDLDEFFDREWSPNTTIEQITEGVTERLEQDWNCQISHEELFVYVKAEAIKFYASISQQGENNH